MADPYNLRRFADAQAGVYEAVCGQLRAGRKTTHWMWFVFPQLAGLGRTDRARYFGIASLDEARAYLADPVLGTRLRECARILRDHSGADTAEHILGPVDALKLRSSMTLFVAAATGPEGPDGPGDAGLFGAVLERYYRGVPDDVTLDLLSAM